MKYKIGLLTMPILDNYGGIIQIAALYHIIELNGYQPILINKRYNQSVLKTFMKDVLENNPFYKIYDYKSLTSRKKKLQKITDFISDYFVFKSQPLYNEKDLREFAKDIDTIVVGSDQVWRYKYVKENYNHYFLSFVDDYKTKIAYAPSFGVDFWEGDEQSISRVKELLNRFKAVSVREDRGIEICNETFDFNQAVQVLDPTLLPDIDFYESIIEKETITRNISLFNYVLDKSESKQKIVKKIADIKSLKIDVIGLNDKLKKDTLKPSLSEWLYHFKKADFVVTDSFHGTVFSIIFNKQFIAIGNRTRGISRFQSLLRIFGLESRLILENEDIDLSKIILNEIDYKEINKKLKEERIKSMKFLLDSLKPM
jgi:hypothetical protein